MTTRLNPYLNFRDSTKEAMEFYHGVFGGTLDMSTFGEYQVSQDPAEQDKIMHAQLETENGLVLMASDVPEGTDHTPGSAHSVSLSGDDEAELRGYWEKLSDGGTVTVPFEKAPWGDTFGMLVDRFGISWLVNAAGQES